MFERSLHRLRHVVAAVLLIGTAAGQPAMVLGSAPMQGMAGHHHHHDARHPAPPANSCCEFCWTACATAPGAPPRVELAEPEVRLLVVVRRQPTGLRLPVPAPHTLPFSQGPPALLA